MKYYITPYWSVSTLILYISIICISYYVATCNKRYIRIFKKKEDCRIVVVSVFLCFFKCLGITGRDITAGYYLNYLSASSLSSYRDQSVEIGFRLLNVIVKNLFNSYEVLIFIIGFLTVVPVMHIIRKYSDKIDVGVSVLLYVSVYYFSGFSAARQYMALSICLLAFDAIYENREYKAVVLIFLASSFHITSILMLIPFFLMSFRKVSKRFIVVTFILVFFTIYYLRNSLIVLFIGRYSSYSTFETVSIGMRCFIYYLPISYLVYKGIKKNNDRVFAKLALSITAMGFLFGMLEYVVSIFGRMEAISLPIIIIIPYYVKLLANKRSKKIFMHLIILAYCFLRFWVFITENYDQQNLMPYINFLGMCI